jgi:hypothetical protein
LPVGKPVQPEYEKIRSGADGDVDLSHCADRSHPRPGGLEVKSQGATDVPGCPLWRSPGNATSLPAFVTWILCLGRAKSKPNFIARILAVKARLTVVQLDFTRPLKAAFRQADRESKAAIRRARTWPFWSKKALHVSTSSFAHNLFALQFQRLSLRHLPLELRSAQNGHAFKK